jgi:mannose-6-phosphate isomerase-like protein (cupin superfamily)
MILMGEGEKRLMRIVDLEKAIQEARELAQKKLAKHLNADEFVEIGDADGFKIYVAVGKTFRSEGPVAMHANLRDVFMLVLQGEMELAFGKGEKAVVKKDECFVLPKGVRHACTFRKMTVVVEGVYEKGL